MVTSYAVACSSELGLLRARTKTSMSCGLVTSRAWSPERRCRHLCSYRPVPKTFGASWQRWWKRHGEFIEVHVATPVRGIVLRGVAKSENAKARAGLLPNFTGVNDPYEVPSSPDLRIDTQEQTPDHAAPAYSA